MNNQQVLFWVMPLCALAFTETGNLQCESIANTLPLNEKRALTLGLTAKCACQKELSICQQILTFTITSSLIPCVRIYSCFIQCHCSLCTIHSLLTYCGGNYVASWSAVTSTAILKLHLLLCPSYFAVNILLQCAFSLLFSFCTIKWHY